MKHTLFEKIALIVIAVVLIGGLGYQIYQANNAEARSFLFTPQGGTGTSTIPTADQILIGGDVSGAYDVKTLIAGTNITISTTSQLVTISSTGGGADFGQVWEIATFGGTSYLAPTTTTRDLLFDSIGFISKASSTIDGLLTVTSTTTLPTSRLTIGTTTPHQAAALNIEILNDAHHGIKITGHRTQDEHLFSLENATGTELFTIGNDGDVLIDHSAEEAGEDALHIDNDINGRADISSISITQVLTGLLAEQSGTGISITTNTADSAAGSVYDSYKCFSLGTGSAELTCLSVGTGLAVIHQNVGETINADSVLLASSSFATFTDITAAANSASVNVELFVPDEFMIIRSTTQFEEMKFDLVTESSKKIFQNVRTWQHSGAGDSWIDFEPASTIDGFEESGVVSTERDSIGGDWVVSTVNGVGSLFSIRVQRTRNNINTLPIENTIQIAATSTFGWSDTAIVNVDTLLASSTILADGLVTWGAGFVSQASSTIVGALTVSNISGTTTLNSGLTVETNGLVYDFSTNRVGIGTTSPLTQLHVGIGGGVNNWFDGATEDGLLIDTNSVTGRLALVGSVQAGLFLFDSGAVADQGMFRIQNAGEKISFHIIDDDFLVVQRTIMTFDNSNGNVGIASSTPWGLLSVEAVGTADPIFVVGDEGTTTPLFYVDGNGNIGIATSSPNYLLSISGGSAYVTEVALTDSPTIDISFASATQSVVTLTANRTVTFSNLRSGATHRLILCQDDTGSRTVDWPATSTFKWIDQTTPTLGTDGGICDVISFLVTDATSTSATVFGILNSDF